MPPRVHTSRKISANQHYSSMDDLFNILSSTARIDKSKRKKHKTEAPHSSSYNTKKTYSGENTGHENDVLPNDGEKEPESSLLSSSSSRDRKGKRDMSDEKLAQVHQEQIAAFRRSMNIRLANSNKHDDKKNVPDPITRFDEMEKPSWWKDNKNDQHSFALARKAILSNIERSNWKEPTPIQMQGIPTILSLRRDLIGAAPTGSGKSGAFLIPAILLSTASRQVFYNDSSSSSSLSSRAGEIRALILAPSLELASQLHREVERLGEGKPGGISSILLAKANAAQLIDKVAGGKRGVDVLVATPMRLVDAIQKGLKLTTVRFVVLDEADRLLDASDGNHDTNPRHQHPTDSEARSTNVSGSGQTQSFLSQMDIILSEIPATAVRALFSATVTPMVRSLSESILRDPLDVTVGGGTMQGGANPDIEQQLLFVGREEGKLLAIRQLVQRGQLRPPVLVFLQSQERAQALFNELLYDGIRVDVIHAGRSKAAREAAVAKFRTGDTWVLICTDLVARGVDFKAVRMVINYDLCASAVTYVHRIGRTGRAGRKGTAITLFTEADFENLRAIANVMRQSGCEIPDWMLNLKKSISHGGKQIPRKRPAIDTTPIYDKRKQFHKNQMIQESKNKKEKKKSKEMSLQSK